MEKTVFYFSSRNRTVVRHIHGYNKNKRLYNGKKEMNF